MADVRAFRGVRYADAVAPELGRLIAPPYDVAAAGAGSAGGGGHGIALLENVDLGPGDPHALAAARYRAWRREGVLARDREPALYLHEHAFDGGGERLVRRGLLARVRLHPWSERVVVPHERTFPGPRRERLARLRAVGANLSPLYLLYRDPEGELAALLAAATEGAPAVAAGVDATGAGHRLTMLGDPTLHAAVGRFFAERRLYVADGHHRYEAALAYRDERRVAGAADPEAGHEFVLALLADVADPGVRVLPTHRLVRGLRGLDAGRVRAELAGLFELERWRADARSDAAAPNEGVVCEARFAGEAASWRLRVKPGRPHERLMPAGPGEAWRRLDAAIVGGAVLAGVLGLGPEGLAEHVAYVHEAAAARRAVEAGEAQLALILAAPSPFELLAVADAGDRLPPKSTWFEPKAPAGLVVNEL